jgi:hypothetical protein
MDLFLSRQEIRRQIFQSAGYTSDALLGSQEYNRVNLLIDDASLKVAAMSRWLSMERRASVPLDMDQTRISYRLLEECYWNERKYPNQYHPGTYLTPADTWLAPDLATYPLANVGPGGIIGAAYWDASKYAYSPLVKARTPVSLDQDRWTDVVAETQLNDVFNNVSAATLASDVAGVDGLRQRNRSNPYSIFPGQDGIDIWPIPDQRYVVRIDYTVTPTWMYNQQGTDTVIDQRVSLVDAKAIVYYAVSEMYAQQSDDYQASRWEKKGNQRISDLKGWQNSGEAIVADTEAAFDNDYETSDRQIPRWNLNPWVKQ